jgi:NAD(P)-dependent dehydrogenase (short-subunit alcohol dehydrogenase family)
MEDVRRQFDTNVFGLLRMCQLVLPSMRDQRAGRIVNMSSMGGNFVFPGGGIYHATKYSVEALSDALRFEVGGFGIQVVVIQPGLIRTHFADTSAATVETAMGDGYAKFNEAVAQATQDAYEKGAGARLGGPPEAVAKVIEKALRARRPKTRYTVTASAKVLIGQRRLMTDRMWDRFVGTQFPRPGKE